MFNALNQVVDGLNLGVIVLDLDEVIHFWNRWLVIATGKESREVVGKKIDEIFPEFSGAIFRRNFRSVVSFRNFAFFSQKVHGYLFPISPLPGSPPGFSRMQQNCVMGPIIEDEAVKYVYLLVRDVTNDVAIERKLAELATRDALTGAYNRRYFNERCMEEMGRAERSGKPFCIALIDIDHFKIVNDTFGHQFGDAALCAISRRCQSSMRTYDTFARYGGEEFCLLLPETRLSKAKFLLERLRKEISELDVEYETNSARITVSAGISELRQDDNMDTLVSRADNALYKAKENGRNLVVCGQ